MQCTHFASSNFPIRTTFPWHANFFFMGINKWLVIWRLNEPELLCCFILLVSIQWSGSNQKQKRQQQMAAAQRPRGRKLGGAWCGRPLAKQKYRFILCSYTITFWSSSGTSVDGRKEENMRLSEMWADVCESNSWPVHGTLAIATLHFQISAPLIIGPERNSERSYRNRNSKKKGESKC